MHSPRNAYASRDKKLILIVKQVWPFDANCCHMSARLSKITNDGWHRMLYSSTHMATVGVKGLNCITMNELSGLGWCRLMRQAYHHKTLSWSCHKLVCHGRTQFERWEIMTTTLSTLSWFALSLSLSLFHCV